MDHLNICTIHEINETDDGQLYLVMVHYEEETLKERISKGPLALSDAIDIATQVGQGLAEAHGAGIVHRDIKPANLLFTKTGVVKILDFGLAKLAGSEGVTQTGTTVGTVAYMSPEQARGQEVDHRTDIWSLGVVLYEMLAGTPPFAGENLLSISNAIMDGEPSSLTGASSSAHGVVTKALSKDRAKRYLSVTDLLGELAKLHRGTEAPTVVSPTQPDVPSIAVLPFDDMSPQKDQDYFCEGMAEEIINALTGLEGLRVAARTSSSQCKRQDLKVAQIGRELDVGTVLEGSVRKAGNRLRITAQLINVSDGFHLWSERYDRDMDDIFAVQDDIARTVVEKLRVKLLGAANTPLVKRPTDNLEAYNLVLQGRHYIVIATAAALEKAHRCYAQALAVDPTYAGAQAGVAMVHATRAILSLAAPHAAMPEAKEAALKAVSMDDTVADAHFAMAYVLHFYEWDWSRAERAYRRALELNPGDTTTRTTYAVMLGLIGRVEEAIAEAQSAVDRDPVSAQPYFVLATVLATARRFEEAITKAHAGIALESNQQWPHMSLGWALAGLGRNDEALQAFRRQVAAAPGEALGQALLAWALGLAGHRQEALTILKDLEQRRSDSYVGGTLLAWVCLGLSDHDEAISWLQQAAEERDSLMTELNTLFLFDPLRSDPRFQALLKKMNFPAATE